MRIFTTFLILVVFSAFAHAQSMQSFEDFEKEFYEYKSQMGLTPAPKAAPRLQPERETAVAASMQEDLHKNLLQLNESFTITVPRDPAFDASVEQLLYSLNAGVIKRVAWSIKNTSSQSSASFTIEYDSDFKVLQAFKNPRLTYKLNNKEKYVLETAKRTVATEIKMGMDDFQKAVAIHDFIVLTTAYDERAAESNAADYPDSYTTYGVFANKTAVCDGYSKAMNLMLNMAGIDSIIVTGTSKGIRHSWNKIKLEDEWYNIDVTFDDPIPDKKGMVYHDYFNITDRQLKEDHSWDETRYPVAAATKYNYFLRTGMASTNYEQFQKAISRALQNGSPKVIQIYTIDYDNSYSLDFMRDMGIKNFGYSNPKGSSGVFTLVIN